METKTESKRLILLIDDDQINLRVLTLLLQHAGYDTMQASDGHEGFQMALEYNPDLVVLDVMMPKMSGIEVAHKLQLESAVPFMFVSSCSEKEIVKQATEHGAVGYLTKPFEKSQLVPAFEAALSRADEIRHLKRSEANLTTALAAGRETSMAVGLLIGRLHTDRDAAFEVLKDYARSNRRKINDVAKELLSAEELNGALQRLFTSRQSGK